MAVVISIRLFTSMTRHPEPSHARISFYPPAPAAARDRVLVRFKSRASRSPASPLLACWGGAVPFRAPQFCRPERPRGSGAPEGESKDPDNVSLTTPPQGVLSKIVWQSCPRLCISNGRSQNRTSPCSSPAPAGRLKIARYVSEARNAR
jgi:hypothetical protein